MYPKKTKRHADPATKPATRSANGAPSTGPRFEVRASGIHGNGVFARRPIGAGSRIIEYTGKVITWKQAQRRHPHDPDDPHHTFFFHIDDRNVIDGGDGGNAARWINHACGPNCEADEVEGRVWVKALRDISPGEELNYDYGLVLEGRHTAKVKRDYACRCGTPQCRGTMLAPKK